MMWHSLSPQKKSYLLCRRLLAVWAWFDVVMIQMRLRRQWSSLVSDPPSARNPPWAVARQPSSALRNVPQQRYVFFFLFVWENEN